VRYAEVLYFCKLPITSADKLAVAMVRPFSRIDPAWFAKSSNTYQICRAGAAHKRLVVDVKCITSVVAIPPDTYQGPGWWCVVYKPGRTAAGLVGEREDVDKDDLYV
jgi:hypothetical protein